MTAITTHPSSVSVSQTTVAPSEESCCQCILNKICEIATCVWEAIKSLFCCCRERESAREWLAGGGFAIDARPSPSEIQERQRAEAAAMEEAERVARAAGMEDLSEMMLNRVETQVHNINPDQVRVRWAQVPAIPGMPPRRSKFFCDVDYTYSLMVRKSDAIRQIREILERKGCPNPGAAAEPLFNELKRVYSEVNTRTNSPNANRSQYRQVAFAFGHVLQILVSSGPFNFGSREDWHLQTSENGERTYYYKLWNRPTTNGSDAPREPIEIRRLPDSVHQFLFQAEEEPAAAVGRLQVLLENCHELRDSDTATKTRVARVLYVRAVDAHRFNSSPTFSTEIGYHVGVNANPTIITLLKGGRPPRQHATFHLPSPTEDVD